MEQGKEKRLAMILSGLVFPGIGQIYLKERVRGILILMSALVLIFYPVYSFTYDILYAKLADNVPEPAKALILISYSWAANKELIIICLVALLLLWIYSTLEIWFKK